MNHADCERWVALSDKAALGLQLSVEEATFQARHERGCPACQAEGSAWYALGRATTDEQALTDADSWRPLPARDLGSLGRRGLTRARGALFGTRKRGALSCAAFAAAAAAAWFVGVRGEAVDPALLAVEPKATLALASGDVTVGGARRAAGWELSEGDVIRVRSGRACLHLEPGVTACLAEASEVTVTSTRPRERVLALTEGVVIAQLTPQPQGANFRVETAQGSVTAKGTVFAVQLGADRTTRVRVHEGTVLVAGPHGATRKLPAPAAAQIGSALDTRPLGESERAQDRALIGLARATTPGASCLLNVTTSPAGAKIALDDTELGPAPVSALVREGRRLSVIHPGYAPVNERVALDHASSLSRSYELSPLAVAAASADPAASGLTLPANANPLKSSAEAGATPSATELLSRARELRAAGRPADAAAAYRRLIGQYPRSDEARASLVSLGELQLSALGDAAAALRSFESYLRFGGALSQEARYGKIRALARLGRRADELAESRNFVRDYPRSVQANSLRARLEP